MSARKTSGKTAGRRGKAGKRAKFFHKSTCTTCRKARAYMEKRGFLLSFRDLDKQRLSAAEVEKLIGRRDYNAFLNPRNELYRSEDMKKDPPSRREAIRMMARTPNLIRRPVILAGGRVVLGFDEDGISKL